MTHLHFHSENPTAEPVHDRGDVEVTLLQQNNYLFATPTLLHQNV
jgi:hypothetical protein